MCECVCVALSWYDSESKSPTLPLFFDPHPFHHHQKITSPWSKPWRHSFILILSPLLPCFLPLDHGWGEIWGKASKTTDIETGLKRGSERDFDLKEVKRKFFVVHLRHIRKWKHSIYEMESENSLLFWRKFIFLYCVTQFLPFFIIRGKKSSHALNFSIAYLFIAILLNPFFFLLNRFHSQFDWIAIQYAKGFYVQALISNKI